MNLYRSSILFFSLVLLTITSSFTKAEKSTFPQYYIYESIIDSANTTFTHKLYQNVSMSLPKDYVLTFEMKNILKSPIGSGDMKLYNDYVRIVLKDPTPWYSNDGWVLGADYRYRLPTNLGMQNDRSLGRLRLKGYLKKSWGDSTKLAFKFGFNPTYHVQRYAVDSSSKANVMFNFNHDLNLNLSFANSPFDVDLLVENDANLLHRSPAYDHNWVNFGLFVSFEVGYSLQDFGGLRVALGYTNYENYGTDRVTGTKPNFRPFDGKNEYLIKLQRAF